MNFPFVLLAMIAATGQSSHTAAAHRPQPACRAISNAMLQGPLALTEPCYSVEIFATVSNPIVVSPGTTIVFGGGSVLSIGRNGSFEAIGTPEKSIVLKGKQPGSGFWGGINIGSSSSRNRLSYVTMEGGGASGRDSGAVVVTPGGQISIDHTTIRNSAGNGLRLMQRGVLGHFEANHFENNDIPAYVKATDASMIDPATTFTANKNNVVFIQFGDATLDEETTWRSLAVPYRFDGGVEVRAHLTIEPGAHLEFRENVPLNIDKGGSLTAIGTPDNPVIFTGTEESSGYWSGIYFESDTMKNILRNVAIRFGGSKSGATHGCVGIFPTGSATVEASTISSCPVGIFVNRGGTLNPSAATSNIFRDVGKNIVMDH